MLFKKFDEKKGILKVEARGNIDFWELLDFYKTLVSENSYPDKLKIFFIATSIKFDFKVAYNDDISEAVSNVAEKFTLIKEAFIVEDEFYDSISIMFDDKYVFENYSFKIFNNPDAAETWLNF
jgi:hypothetical protein